jgi:hypothetical protein
MTGTYKNLDYEVHQAPNATWAGSIETDLMRFYDYRTKDDIVAAIKSSIGTLDRPDHSTRQDKQNDQVSVADLRTESMGIDESRMVSKD